MSSLALALALSLAATPVLSVDALGGLRGKKHILIFFGPRTDLACLEQVRHLACAGKDLLSREIAALHVHGDLVTPLLGDTGRCDAAALREEFGQEGESFAVLLIDKDNSMRLRRTEPVTASELSGLLDSPLPMRPGMAA